MPSKRTAQAQCRTANRGISLRCSQLSFYASRCHDALQHPHVQCNVDAGAQHEKSVAGEYVLENDEEREEGEEEGQAGGASKFEPT